MYIFNDELWWHSGRAFDLSPKFEGLNLASFDTIGRKHQKVLLLFNISSSIVVEHSTHNPKFHDSNLANAGTEGRNCKKLHF